MYTTPELICEQKMYSIRQLPTHLAESYEIYRLYSILTNFSFIYLKITHINTNSLIDDYDPKNTLKMSYDIQKALDQIQSTLLLSVHIFDNDKTQIISQLIGRLLGQEHSLVQKLLHNAILKAQMLWMRPINASLVHPGGQLRARLGTIRYTLDHELSN